MSVLSPLGFQKEAVDKLIVMFLKLWGNSNSKLPLVFKSPTGSGKTFMMASFINELNNLPQWDEDKAFIWITFSDDLAMQSKLKFENYFENMLKNELLTVNDLDRGKLCKNEILFINWQKLVSRARENRVLRRPEDEAMHKETGVYFEDFIDSTHADGREIILVVDESHTHGSTELAGEIVDYINPKLIIEVSATPDNIPNAEDIEENRAGFVNVKRDDVVKEGLIKEKIVVQTEEELRRLGSGDLDDVLLKLGLIKREELRQQFAALGKKINPLVLIQLPNDDQRLHEIGQKKKEDIVLDFLRSKGVDTGSKVAMWFDKYKKNLEFIEENDNEVDFMLFKQAAGTGWDCPRAHILVMFREIQSTTFYAQTVGRILRMAEPGKASDYSNTPELRTGFLYTNYRRNEIKDIEEVTGNKPATFFSWIKDEHKNELDDFRLPSEFVQRVDYGDLAFSAKFQRSLAKSFNEYFEIGDDDIFQKINKKLVKKGLALEPKVDTKLVVDAEFEDFDRMSLEFKRKGHDYSHEMSVNDIEKLFQFFCYHVLTEQTDSDAIVPNVARSWFRLKAALRVWNSKTTNFSNLDFYKIFIADMYKGAASVFRPAITKTLKDYRPTLNQLLKERKEKLEKKSSPVFTFKKSYAFTDNYEILEQEKCLFDRFYIEKNYSGKENETRFVGFIDSLKEVVWWYKNGDQGKDYFALKYFNTTGQEERLFYPDWIIKLADGRVGIFDTKSGQTLNTEGRAKGLAKKLQELGNDFVGGIVRFANGIYEYCDSSDYDDITPSNNKWKPLSDLI
jgi:type III restriction enzyme